ncbi:MAG: peptidylprolyl isomerase [Candidatus Methylomirabilis oxygeniifera]|uniref:Peptidyl-prolyl cis-trans isomerase n=1 Tax=Methylomirabilis oxygeniifera TaxID=671143 RepID=D5MLY9_METO1|nr:MAG: peptidylprolyl isomerase [Candidatus Methylomirabilis oxyfera]CBE70046.1 Peptidyl-prolyl cis-trans isomerase (modular protein) [Candidatus Methylomirabilis oxyfera]
MKRIHYASILATAAGMIFALAACQGLRQAPDKTPTPVKLDGPGIQNGSTVQLEYKLTDEKGAILDTNEGKEPLVYTHGQGQIIPGLEKALGGLRAGDTKHVVVPSDEAYGPIRPDAFVEIPKERIPDKFQTVGAHLVAQGKNGQPLHAFVKEIKEKTIVLDTNHPLAGQALTFDVKVVGIEAAQEKK